MIINSVGTLNELDPGSVLLCADRVSREVVRDPDRQVDRVVLRSPDGTVVTETVDIVRLLPAFLSN